MKRLVVCCDGTWNRPDTDHVTNVEMIARTVETDPGAGDPPAQQSVLYLTGVGTHGYILDRWLGGAFGFGLSENVLAGYRWLALNYDPGDDIFVFGFSRGAYTARSIVGMIGRVGLLTRQALIEDHLPEAMRRYRRQRPQRRTSYGASDARFREVHSHDDLRVRFLGVFDTVGALGVPGALSRGHQFHDVNLSGTVLHARQALAIDEHRLTFEPSLWEAPSQPPDPDQTVKQVWFEGAHSDVGGGYADTGLSDTALAWMVREAQAQGLRFDPELLRVYVGSGSAAIRHDSLTPAYRLLNRLSRLRLGLHPSSPGTRHFSGHERVLGYEPGVAVSVATSARAHFRTDRDERDRWDGDRATARDWYAPDNVGTYAKATNDLADHAEEVVALPQRPPAPTDD